MERARTRDELQPRSRTGDLPPSGSGHPPQPSGHHLLAPRVPGRFERVRPAARDSPAGCTRCRLPAGGRPRWRWSAVAADVSRETSRAAPGAGSSPGAGSPVWRPRPDSYRCSPRRSVLSWFLPGVAPSVSSPGAPSPRPRCRVPSRDPAFLLADPLRRGTAPFRRDRLPLPARGPFPALRDESAPIAPRGSAPGGRAPSGGHRVRFT